MKKSIRSTADLYIETTDLLIAKDESNFLKNIPRKKFTNEVAKKVLKEWKYRFGNSYLSKYLDLKPRYENLTRKHEELIKKHDLILLYEKEKVSQKLLIFNNYLEEQLRKKRLDNEDLFKTNELLLLDAETNDNIYKQLEDKHNTLKKEVKTLKRTVQRNERMIERHERTIERYERLLDTKDKEIAELKANIEKKVIEI